MMATKKRAVFAMKITGVKETAEALKSSAGELARAFAAGLCSGALIVVNYAKDGAPYLTGNLKRSLHIGVLDEGGNLVDSITEKQETDGAPTPFRSSAVAQLVDTLERRGRATVSEGTDVDYAPGQEFLAERMGGGTHGTNTGPFLRPALDDHHDEVQEEITDAMKVSLVKLNARKQKR